MTGGDCCTLLSFSPSAWLDSSYDRHAGKRTITGNVRWLSRGEKETHWAWLWLGELPTALWTSDRAVRLLLEYLGRPSGFQQAPWHHSHYRNIFWHQKANCNWVWTTLADCEELGEGKKEECLFCSSDMILVCAVFISGRKMWQYFNQAWSAFLALLVWIYRYI